MCNVAKAYSHLQHVATTKFHTRRAFCMQINFFLIVFLICIGALLRIHVCITNQDVTPAFFRCIKTYDFNHSNYYMQCKHETNRNEFKQTNDRRLFAAEAKSSTCKNARLQSTIECYTATQTLIYLGVDPSLLLTNMRAAVLETDRTLVAGQLNRQGYRNLVNYTIRKITQVDPGSCGESPHVHQIGHPACRQ
jgi:hypothetical protein